MRAVQPRHSKVQGPQNPAFQKQNLPGACQPSSDGPRQYNRRSLLPDPAHHCHAQEERRHNSIRQSCHSPQEPDAWIHECPDGNPKRQRCASWEKDSIYAQWTRACAEEARAGQEEIWRCHTNHTFPREKRWNFCGGTRSQNEPLSVRTPRYGGKTWTAWGRNSSEPSSPCWI